MSRTLVISDLHIGDPRYKDYSGVIRLLNEENYDRLILNGDVIDLWLAKLKDIVKFPVFETIRQIALKKEVIWVLGNHDYNIRDYRSMGLLPRAYIVSSLELVENKKKILFIHGNIVYLFKENCWLNRLICKLNCFFWRLTGIDLQKLGDVLKIKSDEDARKRKKLLELFCGEFDHIVMGHSHRSGHCCNDRTVLFNVGNTAVTGSYAILENGEVTLHSWSTN